MFEPFAHEGPTPVHGSGAAVDWEAMSGSRIPRRPAFRRSSLALEARQVLRVARERFRQHLERHVTLQLGTPAQYTSPIPPAPMGARISYEPSLAPAVIAIDSNDLTARVRDLEMMKNR
jgi:hypothetical protein